MITLLSLISIMIRVVFFSFFSTQYAPYYHVKGLLHHARGEERRCIKRDWLGWREINRCFYHVHCNGGYFSEISLGSRIPPARPRDPVITIKTPSAQGPRSYWYSSITVSSQKQGSSPSALSHGSMESAEQLFQHHRTRSPSSHRQQMGPRAIWPCQLARSGTTPREEACFLTTHQWEFSCFWDLPAELSMFQHIKREWQRARSLVV